MFTTYAINIMLSCAVGVPGPPGPTLVTDLNTVEQESFVPPSSSQSATTSIPTVSFLQVEFPSYHPTNSVKALNNNKLI